ncbi:26379_t:CDS:2, partial [Gigaspora margarita]
MTTSKNTSNGGKLKKNIHTYKFSDEEVEECEKFELIGEDPVVLQNANEAENDKDTLPCRILEDFIIFDANKKNQVVSLDEIDIERRELHAAGIVKPIIRTANLAIEAIARDPELTEKDIINNHEYIVDEIETWIDEQEAFGAVGCPLIARLSELKRKKGSKKPKLVHSGDTSTVKTKRNINPSLAVRNPTCVTPFIHDLTKGLFARRLVTVKHTNDEVTQAENLQKENSLVNEVVVKPVTHNVEWYGNIVAHDNNISYYRSAKVDDDIISVGDVVYVRNDESDIPWFAKVMYMYDDPKEGKMFHSRFFSHGRDTILDELAGERELFLLDNCEDNNLDTIMGKVNVKRLEREERENFSSDDTSFYFYRFWYNETYASFEDVYSHEDPTKEFLYCGDNELCYSCENKFAAKEKEKGPKLISQDENRQECFEYKGVEYHLNDFVYIIPDKKDDPYTIGQIIEILNKSGSMSLTSVGGAMALTSVGGTKVIVMLRLLGRYDDLIKETISINPSASHRDVITVSKTIKDCRRLFFTRETIKECADRLEGVCWVDHKNNISDLDAYKDENDTYYVDLIASKRSSKLEETCLFDVNDISKCQICEERRRKYQSLSIEFYDYIKMNNQKLRAMDIFSGCGGITVGMDQTGVIDTKWAIEFDSSAAMTFEKNNPSAVVYNQCANLLLERAIAEHGRQEKLNDLKDFLGRKVPSMPAPGDVDFIYCGPPCQGFSGVNRYQKADDIKNSLVATSLSYVDFYKPQYFLLENVRGMLCFRLGGEQDGVKIKGGIKMGVIKFILRSLTAMGYQTRFGVQQAGHHGVPQSRRRLFIWGAKQRLYLPDFPQPSTCFAKQGSISILLPNGSSFSYNKRANGHAPLPAVSVCDAINDLPEFEFVNPHLTYPATAEDKNEKRPFKQVIVPERGWAGDMVTKYESGPLSEYQRQCRKDSEFLHNHVTRAFNQLTVERIIRIPMFPGADHSNLPEKLKPWCLSDPNSAASRHNGWKGLFGRLDFNGHFLTALTDINPMGKTGTVIHPNQRRIITVRECARAQGFPDKFVFLSDRDDVKDMHRQIGNAVPPPLAFSLGRELVRSLLNTYKDQNNKGNKDKEATDHVMYEVW